MNANPTFSWPRTQYTLPHAGNFGINTISPSSLRSLADKVKTVDSITQNVYKKTYKDTTGGTCDDDACRQELYCMMINATMDRVMECRGKSIDYKYFPNYLISTVSNPWLA